MKNRLRIICAVLMLALGLIAAPISADAKTKINKKTAEVTVGKSIDLKVKGTKKKVKWSFNNKKVVAVKATGRYKCRVTGKKAGSATITAKVAGKKYKCRVVVVDKAKVSETTTEVKTETATEVAIEKQTTEKQTTEKQTTEKQTTEKQTTEKQTTEKQTTEKQTTEKQTTEKETTEATTEKETTEATTEKETTEETTEVTTEEDTTDKNTPSSETLSVNAGEYSIALVHSGDGTYYEPKAGGAANLDDFATGYYTAAMNDYDYMNGMAGAYVEITDKDGDKIKVLITDRLPEGAKGDIDLKPDAFLKIEPLVTGRMKIAWKIIPLPTSDPIQYVFKPTSTQYWAEIQVRNHRYPIAKLEYLDASTNTYVELPRQEYNYFTAKNGMGGPGPYTFRVTDIYGHQLVDTGIALNTSAPVNGAANFPY